MQAIECRDLQVFAGKSCLLDGISFSLKTGQSLAIIGSNGAGKTTLLRTLLGFNDTWQGEVFLLSKALQGLSRSQLAQSIAYLPQHASQLSGFSVEEFFTMSSYAQSKEHYSMRVASLMKHLDAQGLWGRDMAHLSGGERQKIMLIAALGRKTPLLFIDEPTSQIDYGQARRFEALLQECAMYATQVAITHNIAWATQSFDCLLALKEKKIFYYGAAKDFKEQDRDALFEL